MKIYQIHDYGGEWEDRFDYIVGSYLSKEKADAEMEQLKSDEELARKSITHNFQRNRLKWRLAKALLTSLSVSNTTLGENIQLPADVMPSLQL